MKELNDLLNGTPGIFLGRKKDTIQAFTQKGSLEDGINILDAIIRLRANFVMGGYMPDTYIPPTIEEGSLYDRLNKRIEAFDVVRIYKNSSIQIELLTMQTPDKPWCNPGLYTFTAHADNFEEAIQKVLDEAAPQKALILPHFLKDSISKAQLLWSKDP